MRKGATDMAQKKKKTHRHKPLPKGMTYADKLAQDRMVKEATEKAAKDTTLRMRADILSQQRLWLFVVAMCRAFGIGEKRLMDFFAELQAASEELEELKQKHGWEYALDKLRQEAEKLSGIPIEYLYEKEILAAKERNEANGVYFPIFEEEWE